MLEAVCELPYVAIPEQNLSSTRYSAILFAAFFIRVPMPRAIVAQAAIAASPAPEFEVVTIKPTDPDSVSGTFIIVKGRHVIARSIALDDLITLAYGVHTKQIVNGPSWLATARFDMDGVPNLEGKPNRAQMKLLFQKLLVGRFQFAFHHEMKELSVYTLNADKSGPKLTKTDRLPTDGTNFSYAGSVVLTVRNASMEDFANGMQATFLDRPVVDQTGLRDRYDFVLKWTPEGTTAGNDPSAPPDLYTAIREQLGLKLNAGKAPVDVLVIDRVEKPSPN